MLHISNTTDMMFYHIKLMWFDCVRITHINFTTDMMHYHIKITCFDYVNVAQIKHDRYDLLSYQNNVIWLCKFTHIKHNWCDVLSHQNNMKGILAGFPTLKNDYAQLHRSFKGYDYKIIPNNVNWLCKYYTYHLRMIWYFIISK